MVSKKNITKLLQYFKIKGEIIRRKIKYMSKPKP